MKGKEDRLSVKSSEPLVMGLDLSSDPRIGEFHPDLFFLPYLTGQRCPGWRDKAKASFLGLTLDTGPEDLLRATLERVCFSLREIVEILEGIVGRFQRIWASGGFTASNDWCQLLADVLGRPLDVHPEPHASVRGAALLAMKAIGWISSWEDLPSEKRAAVHYEPTPELAAQYEKKFDRHRRIFQRLCEEEIMAS
jgi:gluconokinase